MQKIFIKNRENLIFLSLLIVLILILKFAGKIILPFVFAFFIAFVVGRVADKLKSVTGLGKKSGGAIFLVIVYLASMSLIFFAAKYALKELSNFVQRFPEIYTEVIVPKFEQAAGWITEKMENDYKVYIEKYSMQITDKILEISGSAAEWISGKIMNVPYILFSIFVTVLASFFICFDYQNIKNFLSRQVSNNVKRYFKEVVAVIGDTARKMLFCSLTLTGITFVILFISFSLFSIDNSFVLSLSLAVLDALPMIGVGIILVPWAIVSALNANYYFAIGLLCTFFIIITIHNILEPKILGKKIGIHPLLSLVAVYIGMSFGGIITVFILMFTFAVVKYLNENGILKFYK